MTAFLVIILIASIILNGVLGYSTWNLLKKNETTEDYIVHASFEAKKALNEMRNIDKMEMFEKDDDVGQVFQQMVSIVEDFARFLGAEGEEVE